MKKIILTLAAGAFVFGTILTGCNSSAEKVEDAQENVAEANLELEQANQEYLADITAYRQETATRIAANEESIREFNARMARDKRALKAEHKQKIAELEKKNNEMKQKMDNYREEGKDKWLVWKAEFNHDMDEMGKAFRDLGTNNVK